MKEWIILWIKAFTMGGIVWILIYWIAKQYSVVKHEKKIL